jgi:hypothetical protein
MKSPKRPSQLPLPLRREKRWKERREFWRRDDVPFRPEQFGIEVINKDAGEAFAAQHHYECKFPPTKQCLGLYRKTGVHQSYLAGIAAFTMPIQGLAIPCYTGYESAEGLDLGRFALLDEVAFNGESWFLSRALDVFKGEHLREGLRSVISYADPMVRVNTIIDEVVKRAHLGNIYQALSALYAGRSGKSWIWITPTAYVINRRTIDKIRKEDRGYPSAMEHLIRTFGADPRRPFETPAQWIQRILPMIASRVRHPGNHVYTFGLTQVARKRIYRHNEGGEPYPTAIAA